jgi:hypothetical protein
MKPFLGDIEKAYMNEELNVTTLSGQEASIAMLDSALKIMKWVSQVRIQVNSMCTLVQRHNI